jgi:hypothetical protein
VFAFNVLEECLQVDKGKTLLHKYHDDIDVQQVCSEFSWYMKTSTKADHHANELLALVTTTKYDIY